MNKKSQNLVFALFFSISLWYPVLALWADGERDYKRIVVLADLHLPSKKASQYWEAAVVRKEAVRDEINTWDDVDLVVVVGDIAAEVPNDTAYDYGTNYFKGFTKPWRAIVGNHDIYASGSYPDINVNLDKFQAAYNQPARYWSEDLAGYKLYFLSIDRWPGSHSMMPVQLEWMAGELAEMSNRVPSIMFHHAPLYGTLSRHLYDEDFAKYFSVGPREDVRRILLASPQVRMWVSGHTHTGPGSEFAHSRCLYEDRIMNIHCDDLDDNITYSFSGLYSNSLYLYDDYIKVRTYNHTSKTWVSQYDRVIDSTLPELESFDFVVETGSADEEFAFNVINAGVVTVEWGDDDYSVLRNESRVIAHNYETTDIYTVKVSGVASRIAFGGIAGATPALLRDILTPLSNIEGITSAERMFDGATGITSFTYRGWFDIVSKNVTSAQRMFAGASNFDQSLNSWDMGKVTTMASMFNGASKFNGDVGNWDTSSCTSFSYMFNGAAKFNRHIGDWDTTQVKNMEYMFRNAKEFNQDISDWDVSKVTTIYNLFRDAAVFNQDVSNWDTSSVTTMRDAFFGAKKFNYNIGKWNTAKVTTMQGMLRGTEEFNQDISGWNVSNVSDFNYFLLEAGAFSVANYNKLWLKWHKQDLVEGIPFVARPLKCDLGLPYQAREFVRTNFNWSISDGGVTTKFYMEPGTLLMLQ